MAFDLELPDEKEVKEQVEQKLAISEERERTVQEAAREKVEQIMGTDITGRASPRRLRSSVPM